MQVLKINITHLKKYTIISLIIEIVPVYWLFTENYKHNIYKMHNQNNIYEKKYYYTTSITNIARNYYIRTI